MRGSLLRRFPLVCLLAFAAAPAQASKKPFVVRVQDVTSGQTADGAFTSVQGTVDFLDPAALSAMFPNASIDKIGAGLDFRGLPLPPGVTLSTNLPGGVGLSFQANSGDLLFEVPLLGVSKTFTEGTCTNQATCAPLRKDALSKLRDFLKTDPTFLKALLTALSRYSPIEPLAGNPDSLFSRRMKGDFNYGFTNKVSQIWGCGTSAFNFTNDAPIQVALNGSASDIFREAQARAAELQAENEVGLGLLASSTTAKSTGGNYQTWAVEAPLSYTVKLDSDPRKKIHFELPLAYSDTDGAKTYSVGLGLGYTHPLTDAWSLTPAIGAGATASKDLGSGGGMDSFSLTSAYTWRLGSFALSMGNGVGYYSSLKLKIGDVSADANVKNTVFTNGFMLTGPSGLIAKNWVAEYSVADTRITGDKVYTDSYDEVGVALGHISTQMGIISSYTKVGLSYLIARGSIDNISSLRLVLSSRF